MAIAWQDDPFYTELSTIIDTIREPGRDPHERILSSYEDAVKTYELVCPYPPRAFFRKFAADDQIS